MPKLRTLVSLNQVARLVRNSAAIVFGLALGVYLAPEILRAASNFGTLFRLSRQLYAASANSACQSSLVKVDAELTAAER